MDVNEVYSVIKNFIINKKFKNSNFIFLVIILLFVSFIWPTLYRYDKVTERNKTYPIRTNRITGNSEYFLWGRWNSQEKEKEINLLPQDEKSKVTGNAFMNTFNTFSVKLYNGSNWKLSEIIVNIVAKKQDGSLLWERNYKSTIDIEPLTNGEIVSLSDASNVASFEWDIVEIKGYKETGND